MSLGEEFKGLPMESLIGAPLTAACDANLRLAQTTADFINTVGFELDENGKPKSLRTAKFAYLTATGENKEMQKVEIDVPLLSVVQIPSLKVDLVDITFDMEVKTSETSKEEMTKEGKFNASMKAGWGPFSVSASVSGSVSSHKENTRSTDKSAKYHVQVKATDQGMPEGLARVLDIMNKSIVPPSESKELKGGNTLPPKKSQGNTTNG